MSLYAQVKDGSVIHLGSLPKSFRNISGFDRLSDGELAAYGFLPATVTTPTYNQQTQRLGNTVYDIGSNLVQVTYEVIDLSQAELDAKKNDFKNRNQPMMNEFLYNTDWIFLTDAGLSTEQMDAYLTFRANLVTVRDNHNNYTLDQVMELNRILLEAKESMSARYKDFSPKMQNLVDYLASLTA